ncbi:MAG: helix-turn-helix domain-containing protein [bacterium]|nr:helix-turn-helix domain-containing protein [bacterium]
MDRRYSLDDIGLSSKNIFDWSKQGLLLDPVKPKSRRKYSVVEFVWLKLVIGLREFGLSLDAIRNLRSSLLADISPLNINIILNDPELREELSKRISEEQLKTVDDVMKELRKDLGEENFNEKLVSLYTFEERYQTTLIAMLVFRSFYHREELRLLIDKDGNFIFGNREAAQMEIDELAIFENPHINFPISSLISSFVQGDVVDYHELESIALLSKKESQVLNLIRSKKLTSLTIRFDDNQQIKLIEAEEQLDTENAAGELTNYLMRNKFQEIVCKSQDGRIISLRRKTKYK